MGRRRTSSGTLAHGRLIRSVQAAAGSFDRIAIRFGLTPKDRARLPLRELDGAVRHSCNSGSTTRTGNWRKKWGRPVAETDYVPFPVDATADEFDLPTDGSCPLCGEPLEGER